MGAACFRQLRKSPTEANPPDNLSDAPGNNNNSIKYRRVIVRLPYCNLRQMRIYFRSDLICACGSAASGERTGKVFFYSSETPRHHHKPIEKQVKSVNKREHKNVTICPGLGRSRAANGLQERIERMKDTKIRSYSVVEERILPRKSAQSVPQNPLAGSACSVPKT